MSVIGDYLAKNKDKKQTSEPTSVIGKYLQEQSSPKSKQSKVKQGSSGVDRSWDIEPTRSDENNYLHQERQKIINNPDTLAPVKWWVQGVDKIAQSPVGAFSDRAGEAANRTAFFDQTPAQTKTGNEYADMGADALGSLLGFVNPMGAGGAVHAPSKLMGVGASKLLPTATRVSQRTAQGLAGGAVYGATGGAVEGQSPSEILNRAGREGLMFGTLGAGSAMGRTAGALTGAGTFGGMTALEGGSPKDIAIQAGLGLGLGALGGESRTRTKPTFTETLTPELLGPQLRLGAGQTGTGKVHSKFWIEAENTPNYPEWYMGQSGVSRDMEAAGRLGLPSGRVEPAGLLPEPRKPDYYSGDAGLSTDINAAGRKLLPTPSQLKLIPAKLIKGNPDFYAGEHGTGRNSYFTNLYNQVKSVVDKVVAKTYAPGIKPAPEFIGKIIDQTVQVNPAQRKELINLLTKPEPAKQTIIPLKPKNISGVNYKQELANFENTYKTRAELNKQAEDMLSEEVYSRYDTEKAMADANPLWEAIRENGGVKPYKNGYLAEEYNGLPSHIKNKDRGLTMDEMASTLGYESEAQFIDELQMQSARKFPKLEDIASDVRGAAEVGLKPEYTALKKTVNAIDAELKELGKNIAAGDYERIIGKYEQSAKEYIAKNKNRVNAFPADIWGAHVVVGAAKIARGVTKFAEWSKAMVAEFGNGIKQHLEVLWKKSNEVHSNINKQKPAPKQTGEINPDQWQDKAKILQKRETMTRIFEDVMGNDAPEMIKRNLDPIAKEEANRVRWMNKERQEIKNLGFKGKTKESELIQKYGEGQWTEKNPKGEFRTHKYTLEDLKRESPENWAQIKHASEVMKGKYKRYLTEVNKVLVDAGYDPIPERSDYFAHFQEVTNLFEKFGFPVKDNALPTDINGITDDFKPGKNFFAHALQRKGRTTTLDAIQGIDKYVEGVSKLIFHTNNIKRLRALDKEIRNKYAGSDHLANFAAELTEYTNILAGKKARFDRATEDLVGRKLYGAVDRLRRQFGNSMIGANLSAAMTSFIPLTQSAATTSKPAFFKGMFETLGNLYKDDGFINRSDFLTRRIGSDRLVMNAWDKVADKGFYLFKVFDKFSAETIVRAKYNEGITKGMKPAEAMKKADDWAARMMADRSLGSTPTLFGSKTLNLFTQFQLEVNNQISFMTKDIPRNFSKVGAASALAQMYLYGNLFNYVYEKITGRRPAFDPIWVMQKAYQDYANKDMDVYEANKRTIRNIADQLPFAGLFTGGRIPISGALPDVLGIIQGETTAKKEGMKLLPNLLPTGGNQLKKSIQGFNALNDKAVYNSGGDKILYPVKPTGTNQAKGLLFGKSAFPETLEYYDKNRRPLGTEQTKKFEKLKSLGRDTDKYYQSLLASRKHDDLKERAKKIAEDRSLTQQQKQAKIKQLVDQYKKEMGIK